MFSSVSGDSTELVVVVVLGAGLLVQPGPASSAPLSSPNIESVPV